MNCPYCGTINHPQSQDCINCHRPLHPAPPAPVAAPSISAQINSLRPRDKYIVFAGIAALAIGIIFLILADFEGGPFVTTVVLYLGPGAILVWATLARSAPGMRLSLQTAAAAWGAGLATLQVVLIGAWSSTGFLKYADDRSFLVFFGAAAFWWALVSAYLKATRGA